MLCSKTTHSIEQQSSYHWKGWPGFARVIFFCSVIFISFTSLFRVFTITGYFLSSRKHKQTMFWKKSSKSSPHNENQHSSTKSLSQVSIQIPCCLNWCIFVSPIRSYIDSTLDSVCYNLSASGKPINMYVCILFNQSRMYSKFFFIVD